MLCADVTCPDMMSSTSECAFRMEPVRWSRSRQGLTHKLLSLARWKAVLSLVATSRAMLPSGSRPRWTLCPSTASHFTQQWAAGWALRAHSRYGLPRALRLCLGPLMSPSQTSPFCPLLQLLHLFPSVESGGPETGLGSTERK